MDILLSFSFGALLCNAIPHLVSGLRGNSFPTPFATPPGRGLSPPLVNFIWGFFNLVGSLACLIGHSLLLGWNRDCMTALTGAALMGCGLALHFGRVRQSN